VTASLCVRCGRPTPDGYACSSCANYTRRQLVGDPDDDDFIGLADAAPVARDIANGQARRSCIGGGAGGPGIPFDPDVLERLDAAQHTMSGWARHIGAERGIAIPFAGGAPHLDQLALVAEWLPEHVEWMRHRPEADEFLTDVAACARIVVGIARGSTPKRYLGPCGALISPESDEQAQDGSPGTVECQGDVYAREQWDQKRRAYVVEEHGRCQSCRTEVVTQDRQDWLDYQVRSYAFRAVEIAQAYGVNVNTIRSWAARGQLVPHGHDSDGRPLFNVGDVLDLAAADAARRATEQAKRARRVEARRAG
jgi:hypothetical protein